MPAFKKLGFMGPSEPVWAAEVGPPPTNYTCELIGVAPDMLLFNCHPKGKEQVGCIVAVTPKGIQAPEEPECAKAVAYLQRKKISLFTFEPPQTEIPELPTVSERKS